MTLNEHHFVMEHRPYQAGQPLADWLKDPFEDDSLSWDSLERFADAYIPTPERTYNGY